VASEAECDKAFSTLADLLARVDPETRTKYVLDRTVSCRVTDLGLTWCGRVCDEGVIDVLTVPSDDEPKAQVRLSVGSDDLLALIEGRLTVPAAVATGRLRVQANPLDLLRLGSFL
jgi:predicted lipid carrier protein YhbT